MLTDEQRDWVAANLGIVGKVLHRHRGLVSLLGADEAFAAGAAILCRAAVTYRPGGGANRCTHAFACVDRHLRTVFNRAWAERRRCPARVPGSVPGRPAEPRPEAGEWIPLLDALTRTQRAVVELVFGLRGGGEMSQTEVGHRLQLSGQAVHLIYHRALDRMRRRAGVPVKARAAKAKSPGCPPGICRHCSRCKIVRPKRLCWTCYYTPGVKALYPSEGRGRRATLPAGYAD